MSDPKGQLSIVKSCGHRQSVPFTVETAEVMVSQFVRDMRMAESVVVEAVIHCDAGHRVDTESANMNAAKTADMGPAKPPM